MKLNLSNVDKVKYNGVECDKVKFNGVEVWKKHKGWGLITDGRCYIDTGIKPTNNIRVDMVFRNNDRATMAYGSRGGGASTSTIDKHYVTGIQSSYTHIYCGFGANLGTIQYDIGRSTDIRTLSNSKDGLFVDGIQYKSASTDKFESATLTMYLFALNNNGAVAYGPTGGELFSFKVYENDILIMDLLPIPTGNTTYSTTPAPSNCLIDKLTGTYYENQGTGTFSIVER